MIIETCPKCGHDLIDVMLASNPPIPKKECWSCGWSWTGEPEEVVRVPFGGNSLIVDDLVDVVNNYLQINDYNLNDLNKYLNDYNLNDYNLNDLNKYDLKDATIGNFKQSACENCSNNPKNGGSGICHCILGQPKITY